MRHILVSERRWKMERNRKNEMRLLRLKAGKTQEQVARESGISTAAYCMIENGKNRGAERTWKSIALSLGLTEERAEKLRSMK